MVDRLARVVARSTAKPAGRSGGPFQPTPQGPGIFSPGSKAIGSTVPGGMPFANRLCPVENLLRQNASI